MTQPKQKMGNDLFKTEIFKSNTLGEFFTLVKSIECISDEATLLINSEGISCRIMDAHQITLVDVKWPNSAFEKYDCDSEIRIGLNFKELASRLKEWDMKGSIIRGLKE